MTKKIVIGTRESALAMWQAQFVQWLLEEAWPDNEFEIKGITTSGDKDKEQDLSKAGGKGLFIKELEEALLDKKIDLAVHCMKDLPVELPLGCSLAAIVERGEVRDVFLSNDRIPLGKFDSQMTIGTSSLRRGSLLRAHGIESAIQPIRGNVETRIKKMESGEVQGLVLAAAGVLRLGLENHITEYLPTSTFIPAPGQGAIGLECREEDDDLRLKLRRIHHDPSGQAVEAERSFLKDMGANCALPLGAFCQIEQFQMRLSACLSMPDGQSMMMDSTIGPVGYAENLGSKLADRFMSQGAADILKRISQA